MVDTLAILIGWMIFLSPFLDVIRMSISAVFFVVQLDCRILYLPLFDFMKGGFSSSNLAIRVGMKRFSRKGGVGLKGLLSRKGGFFALT